MTIAQQQTLICNAVVLVYMLLASFPCIRDEERAAVQLVLEHIFTFNVRLGRIVLTRQSYERAQGFVPRLLVLASRHGLVYATGRAPSFMNIATILQTIIEPLVINLNTLAWMEVYATEDEARQLLKLSFPHLQVAVDTWVCEYSEITLPTLASITSSHNDPTNNLTPRKHGDVWWTPPLQARTRVLPTGPGVASGPTPVVNHSDRPAVDENVDVRSTSQLQEDSPTLQCFGPASPNLELALISRKNSSHLCARKHRDAWWTSPHQANAPSLSTNSETVHTKPAQTLSKIQSHKPTTCGYEDVWWNSYAQGKSPGAKYSAPAISTSLPTPSNDHHGDGFAVQRHGEVWWNSSRRARGQPPPTVSEFAACSSPTSTLPTSQPRCSATRKHSDVWWVPPSQSKTFTSESTLLQSTETGVRRPHELHHPLLVTPSHNINLLDDRGAESNDARASTSTQYAFTQDFQSQSEGARHEAPTSLYPPSPYLPWDASSGLCSLSREFSTSDPSFGPPTPIRSCGRRFSGSSPSFDPPTPADSVSARWGYDHYVASLDWAPQWDEGSMSEDVHERPQIQVRKAKKATMGRKIVRKLKAVLASVRKSA